MGRFTVSARRIYCEPGRKWQHGGNSLPTVSVEAANAGDACGTGHNLAGCGVQGVYRTVVTVAWQSGDVFPDDSATEATTVAWWRDGSPVTPEVVHVSYARDNRIIDGDLYAPYDADSSTAFNDDGTVFLALRRAPRGGWAIEFSEHVPLRVTDYRKRFATVADAVDYAAWRGDAVVAWAE